jgi:hypothetical protein
MVYDDCSEKKKKKINKDTNVNFLLLFVCVCVCVCVREELGFFVRTDYVYLYSQLPLLSLFFFILFYFYISYNNLNFLVRFSRSDFVILFYTITTR